MSEDIVITFETLFDILRKEKSSNELQKLDANFFRDVLDYFRDKKSLMNTANPSSMFSFEEQQRTQQQLQNAQRLLRDIYEWREKKIMLMARDSSRSKNLLVNRGAMLDDEKRLFDDILLTLNRYRNDVLYRLISAKSDDFQEPKDLKKESSNIGLSESKKHEMVKIRLREDVSEFIGPNMETLGPYNAGDVVELPNIIAGILVNRSQAEKID